MAHDRQIKQEYERQTNNTKQCNKRLQQEHKSHIKSKQAT